METNTVTDLTALLTADTMATQYTAVDIDIGNTAHSGRFLIAGTDFEITKHVIIHLKAGPYTNKGTLSDESEMDMVIPVGRVIDDHTLECYWHALPGPVRGHFTFQYRLASP